MGLEGLDWQLVDVKFDKGLDTRTQRKLMVPGKWTALDNLTLTKDYTLRRRDPFTQLASLASGSVAISGMALYNDELVVVYGSSLGSVELAIADASTSSVASISTSAISGSVGYCNVSKQEVYRSLNSQSAYDCATTGNFTAYTWLETNTAGAILGRSWKIIDETTGAVLVSSIGSGANDVSPRVVATSGAFYFFWFSSATTLACQVVTVSATAQPVVGNGIAILASASLVATRFDATGSSAYGHAFVLYRWNDGVTSVQAIQVDRVGTVPSITTTINVVTQAQQAVAAIQGLACATDDNDGLIGCFSYGSAGIYGATLAQANPYTIGTAATLLDAVAPPALGYGSNIAACFSYLGLLSNKSWLVYTDKQGNQATQAISALRLTSTSLTMTNISTVTLCNSASFDAVATFPTGPEGPWICGKPFVYGVLAGSSNRPLLPVVVLEAGYALTASATQNTTNLATQSGLYYLDGFTGRVVGKALYGSVGHKGVPGAAPIINTPCSSPPLGGGSTSWVTLVPERTTLTFAGGINIAPSNICRITATPNYNGGVGVSFGGSIAAPARAQLGQSLYIGGGSLSTYDGLQVVEHGFYMFPDGVNVTVTAGAGMTAGTHQVVWVYEWVDAAGQRHQSAPSTPQTPGLTVSGGNLQLTCNVPTLQLTQKTNVCLVAYMTQAGGTIFYRVRDYSGATLPNGIANNKAVAYITAILTSSDTAIAGNEVLYTQPLQAGTSLPNTSPPPCDALTVHQNRLWLNASDSPFAYRYSLALTSTPAGPTGLQFNETLGGSTDPVGGDIVGFAELDEKIIILTQRKLYAIFGTGPAASGAFNNYSDPLEIPSDVGCSDRHSILVMPQGVIFKSTKGWRLLGRDLTVKDIGSAVTAYNSLDVTSAVLLEDREECRFTSLNGLTLVYCYAVDQWATQSTSMSNYAGFIDAVWWPTLGAYVRAHPVAGLMKDTTGSLVDSPQSGSAAIVTTARLSFLHLQSLGGFQRARWLYLTASALVTPDSTLTIGVDYNDSYSNSAEGSYVVTVPMSGITFSNVDSIDLRHKLRRQKCKSVSFTFTETPVNGGNALNGMQALSLQIGLKRGTNKLPAGQSV